MNDIFWFLWLAYFAGYNPVFGIPAAIVLFLTAIAWFVNPREYRFRWTDALSLLTPSVFSLLILVCGTVFERDHIVPSAISGNFIMGLLGLEVLLVLWLVWRLQGYRIFALLVCSLQLWFAFLAAFVSGMSITGRWL